jgi:hypothetical protein
LDQALENQENSVDSNKCLVEYSSRKWTFGFCKLTNPGKHFFLQLAADSVEDVNQQVDYDNISYSRKAMIRCGMVLALDGTWSVAQLFPHLQEIVAKHLQYFHCTCLQFFVLK